MTGVLRLATSLRTTLALVTGLVMLSAWGSFAVQLSPQSYSTIERGVLLEWLRSQGLRAPESSWWIFGMMLLAGLLALNTCACSAQRLLRAWQHRNLTRRSLCAHIAHLGFLLVLLAHLIGSVAGFRSDGHRAFPGQRLTVAERPGWVWEVQHVAAQFAPEGYPTSVEARVGVRGAGLNETAIVGVNRPLHTDGVALYLSGAEPTLRGWFLSLRDGGRVVAELGRPVFLPSGSLELRDWAQAADGGVALRVRWTPTGGEAMEGMLPALPGRPVPISGLEHVAWAEAAVDTVGTFDIRYDPGHFLALVGAAVLSASVVPLLWPRRGVGRGPDPTPSERV